MSILPALVADDITEIPWCDGYTIEILVSLSTYHSVCHPRPHVLPSYPESTITMVTRLNYSQETLHPAGAFSFPFHRN